MAPQRFPGASGEARAASLDGADPLAGFGAEFLEAPAGVVYLDGNSLGRPPRAALAAFERTVAGEWAKELVAAWDRWIDLPFEVGDRVGRLLGAVPGQVVVGDSTTVQLYKVLHAIARTQPAPVILVGRDEFPTDRYVAAGVAETLGGRLAVAAFDAADTDALLDAIDRADATIAVVSMVDFRIGGRADVARITEQAAMRGATIVWDLSHAAGVVPVELDRWGVDAAIGCTYKYLHGGPGAPAFAYVRAELQAAWRQPIWGWWGQRNQFEMGVEYDPAGAMHQYAVGTPPVVQLAMVDAAIDLIERAGIAAIDAKRALLTDFAIELVDARLAPFGARAVTPRVAARRGGHVAVEFDEASRLVRAGRNAGVVADFRPPVDGDRGQAGIVRLGCAPLSTTFSDVAGAIDRYGRILERGDHRALPADRGRVT